MQRFFGDFLYISAQSVDKGSLTMGSGLRYKLPYGGNTNALSLLDHQAFWICASELWLHSPNDSVSHMEEA